MTRQAIGSSRPSHNEAQDTTPKTDCENGSKSKGQTDESENDWSKKLDEAVTKKKISIVEELLKTREERMKAAPTEGDSKRKGAPKHKTAYGSQGLIKALFATIESETGEMEIMQCLIYAEGINLGTQTGNWKRTPLHQAVVHQKDEAVRKLLNHPKSASFINLKDFLGRTALHEAVWRDSDVIFYLLLDSRANVDVPDGKSMTALHVAIWKKKNDKRVKSLIEQYGAEVNTRDQYGDSPLHEACNDCNASTIELLLSAGADREVKNVEGKTPKEVLNDLKSQDEDKAKIEFLLTQPRRVTARKYVPNIPQSRPKCLPKEESTCKDFTAYVRYYRRGSSLTQATSTTIHGLVYESESTLKQIERDFLRSHEDSEKGKTNQESFQASEVTKGSMASSSKESGRNREAGYKEMANDTGIWRWVHFPANNMTWIRDFIHTITYDLEHAEQERVWEFVERTMKDRKLVTKDGCSRMAHVEDWPKEGQLEASGDIHQRDQYPEYSNPSHNAKPAQDERSFPAGALSGKRLSIVCPYIDFETEEYINYKHPLPWSPISEQNQTNHSKKMTKLEELYPPFSGLSGLQVPQTLDSSYYDTLEKKQLCIRDQDQVVLKWFNRNKNRSGMWTESHSHSASSIQPTNEGGQSETNAESPLGVKEQGERQPMNMHPQPKLLMVHQLWLWKLDENTIITSCPDRWHAGVEDTLIDTIRQSGVENLDEPELLIRHIMNECVSFLDEFRDAGVGEHILDIFESSASQTAQSEVEAFKKFQKQTTIDHGQSLPGSRRKDTLSVTKEINLMYEVKDLRDEILLLRRVFETQAEILKKLARSLWPGAEEEAKQCRENYIDMCGTADLIDRTVRLDANTSRTLQGVRSTPQFWEGRLTLFFQLDYLVQVKQAQSSLYEAKTTGTLNNYIMLFTIVTILFTPMSFMTSLFAIPVNQFPHNNEGEPRYTPGWLAWRMVVGELVTILVVAIIGALIWNPRYVGQFLWGILTLPLRCFATGGISFISRVPASDSDIVGEMRWDVRGYPYDFSSMMGGYSQHSGYECDDSDSEWMPWERDIRLRNFDQYVGLGASRLRQRRFALDESVV